MALLTKEEIEAMVRAAAGGAVPMRRRYAARLITEEERTRANEYAHAMFPSGGYEAVAAFMDYVIQVIDGEDRKDGEG